MILPTKQHLTSSRSMTEDSPPVQVSEKPEILRKPKLASVTSAITNGTDESDGISSGHHEFPALGTKRKRSAEAIEPDPVQGTKKERLSTNGADPVLDHHTNGDQSVTIDDNTDGAIVIDD